MRSLTHLAAALLIGTAVSAGAAQSLAQTIQLTYTQPLSPGAVQLVQRRLQQLGDYTGAVDGQWGPDSVTALERFQQTQGLQPTGQLNQATVASLGLDSDGLLGAPPLAAIAPSPAYQPALSAHAVEMVQERLRELGYYNGGVDGLWGARTQAAITQFQQGRGLQPNGQLNSETIGAMGLNPNYVFAAR